MPPTTIAPSPFPGRTLRQGHKTKADVLTVQTRLNEVGCGPIDADGDFDDQTFSAVQFFQARFTDPDGLPLTIDGEVGPLTWASLFGAQSVPVVNTSSSSFLASVLDVAISQIGILEDPVGSNRGPQVDKYIRSVDLNPAGHFAWCVAFLYFCFEEAAKKEGRANPMVKTAGVLDHWNKAGSGGIPRITAARAQTFPTLIQPGHLFTIKTSKVTGHTGIIERVLGSKLVTIEGNTNLGGSREGIGVFRRSMRTISSINLGFIDYSGS